MDIRTTKVSSGGPGPATTTDKPVIGVTSVKQDSILNEVKEQAKGQARKNTIEPTPAESRAPTYNGVKLRELGVLLKPAESPQHLVTPQTTTEFSRVYYHDGKYVIGSYGDRLGNSFLRSADYVEGQGLFLIFSTGHRMRINESAFQLTYVPEY